MKTTTAILPLLVSAACLVIGLALVGNALAQPDMAPPAVDAGIVDTSPSDASPSDASPGDVAPAEQPSSPNADGDVETEAGPSLFEQIGDFVQAIKKGDWRMTSAIGLALLVSLLTWLATKVDSFERWLNDKDNDWKKVAFVGLVSFVGATSTSLLGGIDIDFDLFKTTGGIALAAMGAYGGVWKKLVLPLVGWLRSKF